MADKPAKYSLRPVEVMALRWNGSEDCWAEMMMFARSADVAVIGQTLWLNTLGGRAKAEPGDWIVLEPSINGRAIFGVYQPEFFQTCYFLREEAARG